MKITHIEPIRVGISALFGWTALLSVQCRLKKMREPHAGFLKLLTNNLDVRLNVAVVYFDGPGRGVARRTVLNAVFCRWRSCDGKGLVGPVARIGSAPLLLHTRGD